MAGNSERTKYRISPVEGVSEQGTNRWWIPDAAMAALRLAVALLLMTHGLREHFGVLLGSAPWLGAPGLFTDRWIAASLEIVGAMLLAAGAFTRSAALGLALLVALSYFAPARMRGHWMFSGAEMIALYASVLAAIAFIGPGIFSLDALRGGRHRPRKSGTTVSMSPWIRKQYRRRELSR